jgi:hypothetical protein
MPIVEGAAGRMKVFQIWRLGAGKQSRPAAAATMPLINTQQVDMKHVPVEQEGHPQSSKCDAALTNCTIGLFYSLVHPMHMRQAPGGARLQIERLPERVVSQNMVLGALRGIPRTSELILQVPDSIDAAYSTTLDAVTKRL